MLGRRENAFNQLVESVYLKKDFSAVNNITTKKEMKNSQSASRLINLNDLKIPDRNREF
jgi:hypothetical protein